MSAQSAAAEIPDGGAVPWRALEIAGFAAHPGVLDALDPAGRRHRRRATLAGTAATSAMLALVLLILAPIVALAVVAVDAFGRPPAPETSIPAAAVILLCTLPLLIGSMVGWYRSDRRREGFREMQSLLLGGFGLLTLGVALLRSSGEHYPDGIRWSAGIAVPALAATLFWIVLVRDAVRQERARASNPPSRPGIGPEPLRHVRRAVEKLPADAQAAVRADLRAAIDDLERRGVIAAASAARAREAELGKLALRMSGG